MEKPNLKVEEVGKEYIFISYSIKGKTERVFIHPSQMKYFAKQEDRLRRLEIDRDRNNSVIESLLKRLGVNTKNSYTPIALLSQTLLNAKIVLDSVETYAYEIDSMNGYIKSLAKIDGILTEEPEHPQFMHIVDGVLEFDEDKYNAMMSTL